MLSAVTDAVLARIREHAGLLVFDGSPPNLTDPPYVVVWPSYDTENIDRLTMEQTNAVLRFTVHCVGTSSRAARGLADAVRAQLRNTKLDVEGYKCWPIRHEYGLPPQRQEPSDTWITATDGWTVQVTAE